MFKKLPEDVIIKIYEYDGRDKKRYDRVMEHISTINDWYEYTHNTLLGVIPNHYHNVNILNFENEEEREKYNKKTNYYRRIIKQDFKDYFFERVNRFLKGLQPGIRPNNLTTAFPKGYVRNSKKEET